MSEVPAAVAALAARLGLTAELPYTPYWSAAADFLGLIVDHALAARPAVIVECGSGASSVLLARCCAMQGQGHLYSLEQGAGYAAATRAALARHRLDACATVLDAPLRQHCIGAADWPWYDLDGLFGHLSAPIDLLVVDGPPSGGAPLARYPALPLLASRLAPAGVIFLDDAARPGESALLARWATEYPDWRQERRDCERGCAVLRRSP
jgi:predicted O-methyltransferase YrrM